MPKERVRLVVLYLKKRGLISMNNFTCCGIKSSLTIKKLRPTRTREVIMNKSSKVVVTAVVVVLFIVLFAVIVGVRSDAGASTPGILGLILFAALIGGLRAIWKKKDEGNGDDSSQK